VFDSHRWPPIRTTTACLCLYKSTTSALLVVALLQCIPLALDSLPPSPPKSTIIHSLPVALCNKLHARRLISPELLQQKELRGRTTVPFDLLLHFWTYPDHTRSKTSSWQIAESLQLATIHSHRTPTTLTSAESRPAFQHQSLDCFVPRVHEFRYTTEVHSLVISLLRQLYTAHLRKQKGPSSSIESSLSF